MKTNSISFLYHATSYSNLALILDKCFLTQNVGHKIGGYDEDFISVSDILSQCLPVLFGNNIIEFKSKNLFRKNKLHPRIYACSEEDFKDMPFEEAEWISKKIIFTYKDINRIICIPHLFTEKTILKEICAKKNIKIEYLKSEKKLPDYNLNFFINAYYNRIKNAN